MFRAHRFTGAAGACVGFERPSVARTLVRDESSIAAVNSQPAASARLGFQVSLLLLLGLVVVGCAGTAGTRSKRAHYGEFVQPESGPLTALQVQMVAKLCPAGMPQHNPDWPSDPTEFVVREGYALEFSNELRIPLWVCEHVSSEQLNGPEKRADQFKVDPMLTGPRSELADYKGSGFDRGHQAPAGDQTSDKTLKADTFYLSNMAPQVPAFNQQAWAALEGLARDWAIEYGEVWIVTGGLFYDPKEENSATADGWINYSTIGVDGVAVPTHFYKIVARRNDGTWHAIAFVLENRAYARPFNWSEYIVSVNWVEERAGIVFLPEILAPDASALKSQPAALWP